MQTVEEEPKREGGVDTQPSRTEELSQPVGLAALEGAVRTAGVIDVHELDMKDRLALNEYGGAVLAWGGYGMSA